jgi:alpha-mannosidase
MQSIVIGQYSSPVQETFEGGLVFQAQVPSLAYTMGQLSSQFVTGSPVATIAPDRPVDPTSYTLSNGVLTVTLTGGQSGWNISTIADPSGSLMPPNYMGNFLSFYEDHGNLYQFGNEIPNTGTFAAVGAVITTSGDGLGATVLESGPVRVRLKTVVNASVSGKFSLNYTREYCLVAGEPFLRMTTTGAAPSGYSVMAGFSIKSGIARITNGTPCHWTSRQPYEFWAPPVFRPTQHFLLVDDAQGTTLAAIYHHDVPAWANIVDNEALLLGCLFRNTPGTQRGAFGSDFGVHTLRYALRGPYGLKGPETGQPLAEALSYTSPPSACMAPSVQAMPVTPGLPLLAASGSIASVSSPGFILASKPGEVTPGTLILRIYQPANSPQTLTVALGRQPTAVIAVTALEDPITTGAPAVTMTPAGFTIQTETAVNTVQVSF